MKLSGRTFEDMKIRMSQVPEKGDTRVHPLFPAMYSYVHMTPRVGLEPICFTKTIVT